MAAYPCPRCGGPTSRGHSAGAQQAAGLVGALLYAAFAAFECIKCGKIPRAEFADEHRSAMTRNSVFLGIGGVVLLGGVIALLAAVN
jgi:predicted RNA-binding Zn-ribbon protein involved in translation (DUF1610 family)